MPDALTGLPNRRDFADSLPPFERFRSKATALLYVDIGSLIHATSVLGPRESDDILKRIGRLLTIHWPNWASARVGGDEFALIAPDLLSAQAAAEHLQALTEEEFEPQRIRIRSNAEAKGVVRTTKPLAASERRHCPNREQ